VWISISVIGVVLIVLALLREKENKDLSMKLLIGGLVLAGIGAGMLSTGEGAPTGWGRGGSYSDY
jgi:hypothetical protein